MGARKVLKHSFREAARKYREHGWELLPLYEISAAGICSCPKGRECESAGKHPRTRNGLKDATTDTARIREWWKKWPDANVGVRTGSESGIMVLDVDPRHGGDKSLKDLEEQFGNLPETLEAATGGGGRHLIFAHPGGKVPNKAGIAPGLDVRGDGGYIVAPPSNHASGGTYAWRNQLPPAPPPAWLMDLILNSKPPVAKVGRGPSLNLIAEGERNATLTSIAGGFRRIGLDEEGLYAKLDAVNRDWCEPPLAPEELRRIAKSVARYPAVVANRTDLGNATRFAARHGHDLKYVHIWKKWLIWSGSRWRIDDTGEVERLAKDTVRALHFEAAEEADTGRRKEQAQWAQRSESASRIRDMMQLAQSEGGIAVPPTTFDKNPWVLNVQNGTLELKSGELRSHLRSDRCTKLLPTKYVPEAECPRWLRFLDEVTCGDKKLKLFLQRAVGYSLTGSTREQVFFILHGFGANGKTTFIEVIRRLLGDYAMTADPATFLAKRVDSVRNDIARLQGARFVSAQEVEDGRHLAEALVKQMTGGDKLTARFLYAEHFEFRPYFKIFLSTNHKPNITGTDNAMWRRIRLIPFRETFPPDRQDKQLLQILELELGGILVWAVRGCLDWQRNGLGTPPAIIEATQEYREEMDVIGAFIEERCVEGANHEIPSETLYRTYKRWCEASGHKPASQRTLGMRLKERGNKSGRISGSKRRGCMQWRGLKLRAGAGSGGDGEF